ncbi:MAG: hypothetical protein AAF658_07075, partial [Myxococcota bacterium]
MSASEILSTVTTPVDRIPTEYEGARAAELAFEARTGIEVSFSKRRRTDDGRIEYEENTGALRALEMLARGPNGAAYARAYLNLATYAQSGDLRLDLNGDRVLEDGFMLEIDPNASEEDIAERLGRMRLYLDPVMHFLDDSGGETALRPEFQRTPPNELIHDYVSQTFALLRQHDGVNVELLDVLRARYFQPERNLEFLLFQKEYNEDRFDLSDGYGNLSTRQDTANYEPVTERRESGPVETRPEFVPKIPGTETERTPSNYTASIRDAGGGEKRLLTLVTGLSGDELTEVAYRYLNSEETAGVETQVPQPFLHARSEERAALLARFAEALPVDGKRGHIIRSVVENDGFMPQSMRLYLNASGFWSQNGPAVHAQLMDMTAAERTEAFRQIAEPPLETSREKLLSRIDDDSDRRLARFLSVVPKQEDGTIDQGWLIGFQLAELGGDFGLLDRVGDFRLSDMELSELVRISSGASEAEMARAAAAYDFLREVDERDFSLPEDAPAVLNAHANVDESALAKRFRDEVAQTLTIVERVSGDNRQAIRDWTTALLRGMRYDPTSVAVPAGADDETIEAALIAENERVSERNALILGGALNLARLEVIDRDAMTAALTMIDRD